MKNNILLTYLICLILTGISLKASGQDNNQEKKILPAVTPGGKTADVVNVRYGNHERNVFDLWIANTDQPSPLVIYIHGGGFTGGDKSEVYKTNEIDSSLNNGISFASINYRYRTEDSLGVRASLYDSKRALQYIRSRAKEWNVDGNRIACYGGSAGAGTSLWLAFHDDMADPENEDPVMWESTRIMAAVARATQATYNLSRWYDILKMEENGQYNQETLRFYGFNSAEELNTPAGKAAITDLDMLEMMDSSDPPFFVLNNMKGGLPPENRGHMNHHPLHAKALKDRADEVGVEAVVYAPKIGIEPVNDKQESMIEFIVRILKNDKE